MEIIAAVIAALLGWQNARFGRNELKALAIVVVGWTAVTTAAGIPNVSFAGIALDLVLRSLVIAVPYTAGGLIKRWRMRKG